MRQYNLFIPQNKAPSNVTKIGIYDQNGERQFGIMPNKLASKIKGNKLYSFALFADIHLQYSTGEEDFIKALNYINNDENINFCCIAGDLTVEGTQEELSTYKSLVEIYARKPVYATSGNHDARNKQVENLQNYTNQPFYFSFEYNNDVFIFVGNRLEIEGGLFTTAELQWLYETLEANRNKRCFVVEHVRPQDGCGNALGVYKYDLWGGTEATVFESLMRHYKNVILCHGHSHLKYYLQNYSTLANYDNIFGIHSIHISSLAMPRDISSVVNPELMALYAESEGYIVDVYDTGIMLKARDFKNDKWIPIAFYWLQTPLQNITAGTYSDSTGTIIT